MKISAIELVHEQDGLQPFKIPLLGDLVLITGSNGAGKTRLLKMIQNHISLLHNSEKSDAFVMELTNNTKIEKLTIENADQIKIINYSHYDVKLQSPRDFSPYVIHKAKDLLKVCDYEETALNSLLLIEDMAKGYSEEFKDRQVFEKFAKDIEDCFDIKVSYDEKAEQLLLFGLDVDEVALSPGQQYLLRMAVACLQNEDSSELIFFMDEPEQHLHPKALLDMIEKLRKKFPTSQFWISTHSLSLVSYYTVMEDNTTTLYLHDSKVNLFRSDSSGLLDGLIGNEKTQFATQQLWGLVDEYACNKFTFECFDNPQVVAGTDGSDLEVNLVKTIFKPNDIIVDYGAGKGRFLEEFALGNNEECGIRYYAYDIDDKDATICKRIMNMYGSTEANYFNDIQLLGQQVAEKVDYVLLVNVLHEIPPKCWCSIFQEIKGLLKSDGKLIIVERDELMIGEAPYEQGFLMLTSNGAKTLFGEQNIREIRHNKKKYIVKYIIDKEGLDIDDGKVLKSIEMIQDDSLRNIKEIKSKPYEEERFRRFKLGMKFVFWLHQYANSSLIQQEWNVIQE